MGPFHNKRFGSPFLVVKRKHILRVKNTGLGEDNLTYTRRRGLQGQGDGRLEYYGSSVASVEISEIKVGPKDPPEGLFVGEDASIEDLKGEFGELEVRGTADLVVTTDISEALLEGDPNLTLRATVSWNTGGEEEVEFRKLKFVIRRLVPKPSDGPYTIKEIQFEAGLK